MSPPLITALPAYGPSRGGSHPKTLRGPVGKERPAGPRSHIRERNPLNRSGGTPHVLQSPHVPRRERPWHRWGLCAVMFAVGGRVGNDAGTWRRHRRPLISSSWALCIESVIGAF